MPHLLGAGAEVEVEAGGEVGQQCVGDGRQCGGGRVLRERAHACNARPQAGRGMRERSTQDGFSR